MKKMTTVICLFIGCLLVGVVIASVFQETNRQPSSVGKLAEEEKEEAIKEALSNASVK